MQENKTNIGFLILESCRSERAERPPTWQPKYHRTCRSERSDLRHDNLIIIRHIGGRYTRSDLQDSLFTITDVIKNAQKPEN